MTEKEVAVPINIRAPDLADIECGESKIRWIKKTGDEVRTNDVLAEIETDKATMEVEAVDEGVLTKILVDDGKSVSPGDVIAVISSDEDIDADPNGSNNNTSSQIDMSYFNTDFELYDSRGQLTPQGERSLQLMFFKTEVSDLIKSIEETYTYVHRICSQIMERR